GDPATAFCGYHADAHQLTLYFRETGDSLARRGWTLNTLTAQWTPERYQHGLTIGFSSPLNSVATQWNQLVGAFSAQLLTYNQLLGTSANFAEATAASAGTVYIHQHPETQATDDGVAVLHEATLATPMSTLPERTKFVDRVRLDVRADSTSSLSLAVSGDLGTTYPQELALAVSATSASSQLVTAWSVGGANPTIRVRSTGGSWELDGVAVQARILGEQL